MGKSSTGKDTIYKHLMQDSDLGLKKIVMYTTRPIRAKEKNGREYHFVSEAEYKMLKEQGKIIEERNYHTQLGLWRYFTVWDDSIDLRNDSYAVIGTLESYIKTKEYLGEEQILPILVTVDDGIRLQRALDRERAQDIPKYDEMCRRYLADDKDFSKENIQQAQIERQFENNQLEDCVSEIKEYIKNCTE